MTAQGGDLLAWLDNAITERERAARAADASDPSPWTADMDAEGTGLLINADGEPLWDCENSSTLCMTATASAHAALNDPASVLRRCAADRKLLDLHRPVVLHGGGGARYFEMTKVCKSCEPPVQFPETAYPCPTIVSLAKGYGWTAPQTPPTEGDQVT